MWAIIPVLSSMMWPSPSIILVASWPDINAFLLMKINSGLCYSYNPDPAHASRKRDLRGLLDRSTGQPAVVAQTLAPAEFPLDLLYGGFI